AAAAAPPPAPAAAPAAPAAGGAAAAAAPAPAPAAAAAAPGAAGAIAAQPSNLEDAVSRLQIVAKFLRQADKASPAAYLMCAGFRWGELRAKGATVNAALLDRKSVV